MNDLSPLGLISITGPDAAKFLQGQLTCDVREVTEQQSCLGAHCDPKGRVQFTFRLFKHLDVYYLRLPREMISHALSLLQKYIIFSKAKLADVSDEWSSLKLTTDSFSTSQLQDIEAGIPTITTKTIGLFTPHDINYPLLNGVSFNKGCYTGQEIVARMHFLGKPKQRLYRVSFSAKQTPEIGAKLLADQKEVGTLVNFAEDGQQSYQALVVLQNSAIGSQIFLDQSLLTVLDLPYTS